MIEFEAWAKTPRLFRDITITEKIDGTNSAIIVSQVASYVDTVAPNAIANVAVDGERFLVGAQSRNRLITPASDNFGFAAWVQENAAELASGLGVGRHFGEWWGKGIQRGYGLAEKRFSLFNVHRYSEAVEASLLDGIGVGVVPTLYQGPYSEEAIRNALRRLTLHGSVAAPGFMGDAEGVIVYHSASRQVYKVLLENDHLPKGLVA